MIDPLPDHIRIAGTVLLPGGRLERAIVHVDAGRISALEMDPSPALVRALRRDASGAVVLSDDEVLAPAFIDVHCHGAGGGDVLGGTSALERMAATLLRHGVGSVVATVSTAPIAQLMSVARMLDGIGHAAADDAERPPGAEVLGLHLEGPVLSPVRSGGHDPTAFAQPADLARSLAADRLTWQMVRLVTLAPELEGGLELVRQLSASGIVASIGHTDASMEIAVSAYAAGARSTTHLLNGMPPLRAREPGPVGAALAAAPFVELITDGIHVDPGLLAPLARAIGDERLAARLGCAAPGGQPAAPRPHARLLGSHRRVDAPCIRTAHWPAAYRCSTAWWPAPYATASHSRSPCAPSRRTRRACWAWTDRGRLEPALSGRPRGRLPRRTPAAGARAGRSPRRGPAAPGALTRGR